ncbi:unnamed protein product [Schistosoma margrebowiei]|uniref:Uncharacterized protein n=1 Tax=Schistosoma margrebowiei TaxID=48269 RepID=A0A183M7J1_9TREM|nr:unnamed protein product [Schistosoma margrebowiei]
MGSRILREQMVYEPIVGHRLLWDCISSRRSTASWIRPSVRRLWIQFQVFLIYIKNIGLLYSLLVLLFYPLNHLLSLGTNLWLADWSNDAIMDQYNLSFNNTSEQFYSQRNYRLSIYALIGTLQGIV